MCEEYFNGATENELVHAFSIAKSVVAILMGIAIDKGYIKSVNQKVLDFFPDYKLKRNQEQLKDLCIENFLTMTVPYKYRYEPWTKVYKSQNWGEKILELIGGKYEIGERFHLGIKNVSDAPVYDRQSQEILEVGQKIQVVIIQQVGDNLLQQMNGQKSDC